MATEDLAVAASTDDADVLEDDTQYADSGITVRCVSHTSAGGRRHVGLRFVTGGVGLDQGDTVVQADLVVVPTGNNDANLTIDCEAHDDGPTFSEGNDPKDRTLIGLSGVSWIEDDMSNPFPQTQDITGPVQDVVDRGGWAAGNAIVVLLTPNSDVNKALYLRSYDNGSVEPELNITYTPAASGLGIPIVAHHYRQQQGVN